MFVSTFIPFLSGCEWRNSEGEPRTGRSRATQPRWRRESFAADRQVIVPDSWHPGDPLRLVDLISSMLTQRSSFPMSVWYMRIAKILTSAIQKNSIAMMLARSQCVVTGHFVHPSYTGRSAPVLTALKEIHTTLVSRVLPAWEWSSDASDSKMWQKCDSEMWQRQRWRMKIVLLCRNGAGRIWGIACLSKQRICATYYMEYSSTQI